MRAHLPGWSLGMVEPKYRHLVLDCEGDLDAAAEKLRRLAFLARLDGDPGLARSLQNQASWILRQRSQTDAWLAGEATGRPLAWREVRDHGVREADRRARHDWLAM